MASDVKDARVDQITLHKRLALSAMVVGVTVWMRVVDFIPDRRARVSP